MPVSGDVFIQFFDDFELEILHIMVLKEEEGGFCSGLRSLNFKVNRLKCHIEIKRNRRCVAI